MNIPEFTQIGFLLGVC